MRLPIRTAIVITMLVTVSPVALPEVASTRHNLSVSGPGAVKASTENEICVFCHTPHNASTAAQLWNRSASTATYVPYSSSTAKASPGQPTGSSILCLSCHDGTVALGNVLSRTTPIAMAGGLTTMPSGAGLIGTNLTHDHPFSFPYTSTLASQQGELADPASLRSEVRLDASGQLQCSTCHDPHDDRNGKFLVLANQGSALCTTCHTKASWSQSAHATSTATWNGQAPDPWPTSGLTTVAANACGNCHLSHAATGGPRLLPYATEEANCSSCHNAKVATQDVMAAFSSTSSHPIGSTTGVHDPAEQSLVTSRHVECADCHEPHSARANADAAQGALRNVRGINLAGAAIEPITRTHELCFRCHSDSPGLPAPRTARQIAQSNTRLEFQLGNPSFHPVGGAGRNADVPSLIAPWTTTSTMDCTDCHNNSASRTLGGSGADGPHGSSYRPLLNRNYITTDNTAESSAAYSLCYACHSRTSILNDASFGDHDKHIRGESTPCNVCHDPHGVSATQGTTTNNSHLINFDTSVVLPNSDGQLRFVDGGRFTGSCDLLCHGKNHRGENY
ncbi:MAG: hypothetical protein IT483_11425 [Gammaproteobacteria bacterium]|nr:hypothetical protein [Gammaproteobacteria bacterium]